MPEGISEALPYIDKLLEVLNIPKIYKEGFEADDVIGTLAKQGEKKGYKVYMMTSDKDFAQLVSENIFMYRPGNKWQPTQTWGIKEVLEKFNIRRVNQVIDFLAMMGDAADNIPGISGVGKKTAQKFIAEYDSIEGLFANADSLKGKIQEKVKASKEIGMMSKKLVTIITDVPINFDEENMKLDISNKEGVNSFFDELEFRNIASRLFREDIVVEEPEKQEEIDNDISHTSQIDMFLPQEKKLKNIKPSSENKNQLICSSVDQLKIFTDQVVENNILFFQSVISNTSNQEKIIGFSLKTSSENILYVPLIDPLKDNYLELIKELIQNEHVLKVGYNIKNQIKIFLNDDIVFEGNLFDIAVAHYILHPDKRHNLDILSESYLSLSIDYDNHTRGKNKYDLSSLSLSKNASRNNIQLDVICQLYVIFKKELKLDKSYDLFNEIEMPLLKVLSKMEKEGIKLDVNLLNQYSGDLEKTLKATSKEIFNLSGSEFNISSPKQLGEVLFEQMELVKKPKKTKSGQYSTSEETLQKIRGEHKVIEHILDYREIKKLLSTYVNALPIIANPKTNRIHTTFNQSVAATGRLSSVRPNLQNIPIRTARGMKIREAFIAKDNCVLLAADYSQIELRIMASLSKDKSMLEAFNQNIDIHSATAAKVYNVDLDDVTRSMRGAAKSVNFGIIYGISAFGLSQNIGVSRKEAKQIIDQYFEEFPGVKDYMDISIQKAREQEYVETIFGRRRYLKDINSRNAVMRAAAERNAINAPIQGAAADIIKIAMIDIDKKLKTRDLNSKMLLQIHDELIFDVVADELEILKKIVMTSMSEACQLEVPLIVDVGVGANWLEAH
jgi:DNA polymerase-1